MRSFHIHLFLENINAIIPIAIKMTKPMANIAERMEHNHATKVSRHTIPPPIKISPKHPGNRFSSELFFFLPAFNIAYPIGIAIIAIIRPVKTSLPPGSPKSGASGSYPLPLGSAYNIVEILANRANIDNTYFFILTICSNC